LPTPAQGVALDVGGVEPGLAAEEALAHVLDVALDVGLARGMPRDGGIDDEAPVAGVLVEGALKDGIVAVRLADGGFEVVEDDTRRHATEEAPGRFDSVDQVGNALRRRDVDVLMAAVD